MKNSERVMWGLILIVVIAVLMAWNRKAGLYIGGATLLGLLVHASGRKL